jgi:hypothetical protein
MSQLGSVLSVEAALKAMDLTDNFKSFARSNRELWSTFGKMDSHLYRAKLFKLFALAKLTPEQIVVVYFLFAVVKKKSRVLDGLNGLNDTAKAMPWYDPVKTFIAAYITDYNSAAKSAEKFPGTHVPTTNPGMDLLMWRLMTSKEERSIDGFFARTTSIQLKNGPQAQEKAKSGYKSYWDNTVKGSKNSTPTEEAKYREEYYETSAGDEYFLLNDDLKEVKPANPSVGYTLEEIEKWMVQSA